MSDIYVAIDAPFWDDELILEDLLLAPDPVAALSGFGEADDVALLDGFDDLGGFCDVMEVVAPLAAVVGASACSMIDDKTDRRTCERIAATGTGGAAAILAAAGCGSSSPSSSTTLPSGPTPAEEEAARRRAQLELERMRAKERRNNLLLVGGGVAAAGIAAVIALR